MISFLFASSDFWSVIFRTHSEKRSHLVALNLLGQPNRTDKGPVTSLYEAVIFLFLFSPLPLSKD
ncbi:MAG: hypothetical protein A2156_12535 [Deltaproteobacteria bacterium RBG_16_48_10]|nr:MAG: hypothetical protein A2156_12535 [Deltaproteobacteria bacterium RBG_16_48_10]